MRQTASFGELIRRLRDERGWTQAQLSRESGLTITCLSNIERGATREPNAVTITGLAVAFGLDPSELDARRLAQAVAEKAKTFAQRQAITRLLALSDRDAEAVISLLDARTRKRLR